ncbi:hypothetical protein [Sphingobacterium sp. SYP-B4668]|uniref:hypothetical protein n=1 Tax=Sphingobacterium sp. SYP-B4668 TaxID=2996035 RepID=UPI0022DD809E|nr:hypothetical protein [Sphingobacterium sp. SYP-B4668]
MVKNWIPYKLEIVDRMVRVLWLDLGDRPIAEPFFDETIQRSRTQMRRRSHLVSVSTLAFLCDWALAIDSIQPTAFIFHVSRCGSTLLSQCLATDTQNIVIPEAPLLDEILCLDESMLPVSISRENLFKAALALLGQSRLEQERFFVKLDSWHVHRYDWLRQWFPNTPFYFLSREPQAIIRSHEKRRGIQMIPGYLSQDANPVKVEEAHYRSFSLFTADVLTSLYNRLSAIRSSHHALDCFFDYGDGMLEMLAGFDRHVGHIISNWVETSRRLSYHSKYPEQIFEEEQSEWSDFPYRDCLDSYLKFSQLSLCR